MGNVPKGKQRQFKLSDREIEALDRIATERGLLHGGVPSRSAAIRSLIEEHDPEKTVNRTVAEAHQG